MRTTVFQLNQKQAVFIDKTTTPYLVFDDGYPGVRRRNVALPNSFLLGVKLIVSLQNVSKDAWRRRNARGPPRYINPSHCLGVAMRRVVLLVSRDENFFLSKFRCDTLQCAGYRTIQAESLGRAIPLVFSVKPDLVILEESITEGERNAFIECLQESNLGTQILFLQTGDLRSEMLLEACRSIMSAQQGSRQVHALQEFAQKKSA